MRIAHISDCYLPRLGGIEVQVTELTKRQAAAGDHVDVITATPGETVREGAEEIDGVTVHRVTARMPFELPVHPRTRAHVAPLLTRLDPDVVHVHLGVVSPFAWGGIRAAAETGLPVLATVHSIWGGAARSGYRLANLLAHWTARGVQPAAVSQVAADRIRAALAGTVDVLITPNGVDPAEWNADSRDLSRLRDRDAPVAFVTAMRLAPRKRALPLLEVFVRARDLLGTKGRMTLAIAGDGPMRPRLQSFMDEYALGTDVQLLGRLSRPELRERYLRSDVFIQPSVKESFGLAALEARATGLPVIARSESGLTEFVEQRVEGMLADHDAGLAHAMVELVRDRGLLETMTRYNSTHEPVQTWPNVLGMIADAYDVSIARRNR